MVDNDRTPAAEPFLTALMPLKNYHLSHLRKAVDSIINQTSPRWRLLIIVEKDELDFFKTILAEALADFRIKVIENEGRKLSGAFNSGMRHAQTQFVAILLADDMWTSDAVAVLGRHINEFPSIDFFHSSRRYVDENDLPISSIYPSKPDFRIEEFFTAPPVKHLLCWRKSKALAFGGMDESLNSVGPDDYDFPWSMAEHGATFKAIKECLYLYREHLDAYRLTTHLPLSVHQREIARIMKKHGAGASTIRIRLSQARSGYLRQCLYRSRFDQWVKLKLGLDLRRRWWRPEYH